MYVPCLGIMNIKMTKMNQTSSVFNNFLEAQKYGVPDAVKVLYPLQLRYFSPSELLRLFCFDPPLSEGGSKFKWPDTTSTKTKYKLIGNSVNVEVVRHLLNYLLQ